MNEEQIVRRGAIASSVLQSEDYLSFYNELKSLTLESIAQTKPEQNDERERLYYQFKAVEDILGIMQSYIDAAKAINERNERESD
jgi:hypothetical protein